MSDQRIVFTNPDGSVGVIVPAPGVSIERAAFDVPHTAVSFSVVPVEAVPEDRAFRAAWRACPVHGIREDIDAARECAHGIRRALRESEFAPHDSVVAKAIPGKAEAAEQAREAIRRKYADIQTRIDGCATTSELREALNLPSVAK